MESLLKLCFNKALSNRASLIRESTNASPNKLETLRFAKVVQQELVREVEEGKIILDWHKRPPSRAQVLNPNPQNEVNQKNCEELEARLRELEDEKRAWEEQLAAVDGNFRDLTSSMQQPLSAPSDLNKYDDDIVKLRQQLETVNKLLNELADGTHRMDKINMASKLFIERKLQDLYSTLNTSVVDNNPSPRMILQALSRVS
jgi:chromosome segregation ATPase